MTTIKLRRGTSMKRAPKRSHYILIEPAAKERFSGGISRRGEKINKTRNLKARRDRRGVFHNERTRKDQRSNFSSSNSPGKKRSFPNHIENQRKRSGVAVHGSSSPFTTFPMSGPWASHETARRGASTKRRAR